MCVPILSHNSPTNNVLLKITVPKRTGRKRKRGSDDAFAYANRETPRDERMTAIQRSEDGELRSRYGMDKPSVLFRKIADNQDIFQVEAVAEIRQTHRYRGKQFIKDIQNSTLTSFKDSLTFTILQATLSLLPNSQTRLLVEMVRPIVLAFSPLVS